MSTTNESTSNAQDPFRNSAPSTDPNDSPCRNPGPENLDPILERITALERQISDMFSLVNENRRLSEELRLRDREMARKDLEIETLKRDLIYQKKLLEKEIEDRARVLDEKSALLNREITERVARERDELDRRLAAERDTWSDRLAREQEKHAANLAEAQTKQGFWSRLIRMLTWS